MRLKQISKLIESKESLSTKATGSLRLLTENIDVVSNYVKKKMSSLPTDQKIELFDKLDRLMTTMVEVAEIGTDIIDFTEPSAEDDDDEEDLDLNDLIVKIVAISFKDYLRKISQNAEDAKAAITTYNAILHFQIWWYAPGFDSEWYMWTRWSMDYPNLSCSFTTTPLFYVHVSVIENEASHYFFIHPNTS